MFKVTVICPNMDLHEVFPVGGEIKFSKDKDNDFDPNAIKVLNVYGAGIFVANSEKTVLDGTKEERDIYIS
jgi:hypothetical protein